MAVAGVDAPNPPIVPSGDDRAPVRSTVAAGGCVAAAAGMTLVAGSFAPALLLAVLALGVALRPRQPGVGLAASVLVICTTALVLITVPIRLGLPLPWWLFPGLLLAVIGVATWSAASRWSDVRVGLRLIPVTVLIGPVLLLLTVVGYAVRWGPIPAWAMSGDARNHLLTTEAIVQAGGWTFLTAYPALENSLVALVGLPRGGDPLGTALILDVQTMAQVMVVILVLLGLLAGLIAAGRIVTLTAAAQVRAAAGSLLVVSPLLLGGTLIGGFHAVPLAVLIVVAVTGWLVLTDHAWWAAAAVAAISSVLLATAYPLIAPVAVGAFLGWWVTRAPTPSRAVILPTAVTLVALAALGLVLWLVAARPDLVAILIAAGGIARRSPPLLIAPIALALVSWVVVRTWLQARGIAVVAVGSLFLGTVVAWLVWLAADYSYYAEKTLWLGVVGLLPVAAARLDTAVTDTVRRALAPAVTLVAMSWVPLLFGGGGVLLPSVTVLQGWWSPSAAQVQVVQELPDRTAHNYLWQIYGGDADRPVNNWLSSWNAPIGDINFSQPALSWTHAPTAVAAKTYCFFLVTQPDSIVWAPTPASAKSLRRECDVADARIRVLEPVE